MPRTDTMDKSIETWEVTTNGTVWVWVYDRRTDRYVKQRVGGRQGGSKRLRISTDDRRYNQEQVVEEMKQHDPFTNGLLRLVSRDTIADDIDATYHLTAEDLGAILKVDSQDLFEQEARDITSELVLRRLLAVAESGSATVAQLEFLRELINERFKGGGTQRTVREMLEAGESLGTVLS